MLAYYIIHPLENPLEVQKEHIRFLKTLDSKGRIYIAHEGVNAQLSLKNSDVTPFLEWLEADPRYKNREVKIHLWHEHPFHKLTVKVRKELVAMNLEVDLTQRGEHITPEEWRRLLEKKDPHTIILDVRNNYESHVGHFEGAICPDIETFREFPQFAKDLADTVNPSETRVLMYCTGGIRCEIYSPLLKTLGFKEVLQLQGGVIGYGLQEWGAHWKGKLFVFDDRLVVPISQDGGEPISLCQFCQSKSDTYYNCANMDCNALVIACPACMEKEQGCCQKSCLEDGRVRKMDRTAKNPKPFRKLSFEEKKEFTQKTPPS